MKETNFFLDANFLLLQHNVKSHAFQNTFLHLFYLLICYLFFYYGDIS